MGETVIEEIIMAVADAENTEPEDLDVTLQDWIETDAIRGLVDHEKDTWSLEFEVLSHSVTVTGDGIVLVDGAEYRTFI